MTKNTIAVFENGAVNEPLSMVNGDSTTEKTVFTAPAEGCTLKMLSIASTSSADELLKVSLNNGATSYIIGQVPVPLTAGTDSAGAVPPVSGLNADNFPQLEKDLAGNPIIKMDGGWKLNINAVTAITDGKVDIVAIYDSITAD